MRVYLYPGIYSINFSKEEEYSFQCLTKSCVSKAPEDEKQVNLTNHDGIRYVVKHSRSENVKRNLCIPSNEYLSLKLAFSCRSPFVHKDLWKHEGKDGESKVSRWTYILRDSHDR
jgi:hypothetical protein